MYAPDGADKPADYDLSKAQVEPVSHNDLKSKCHSPEPASEPDTEP